jgi:hypothetical protein
VANVTSGSTTISNLASIGAKLKLQFTNALTNFSDAFWDVVRSVMPDFEQARGRLKDEVLPAFE